MHRVHSIRSASALVLALSLSACQTSPDGGGPNFKEVLAGIARGPGGSAPAAAGNGSTAAAPAVDSALAKNPLAGTELDGLFKKKPISNSNRPERWPRVALTIKTATANVHGFDVNKLQAEDCITFDARLWRSAADSQKFENLRLCTPVVSQLSKGVAFRTLELFPRYTVPRGENSTANQRTDGPNQPFYMFPQDMKSMQQWTMGPWNNKFFLGTVLLALGYDWDNDFDRRVWVVSVPLPTS